jgi:hypothetical protein
VSFQPLRDWQKELLEGRLKETGRNPEVWIEFDEVEEEIRAELAARRHV